MSLPASGPAKPWHYEVVQMSQSALKVIDEFNKANVHGTTIHSWSAIPAPQGEPDE
jgi:hypothetical protein